MGNQTNLGMNHVIMGSLYFIPYQKRIAHYAYTHLSRELLVACDKIFRIYDQERKVIFCGWWCRESNLSHSVIYFRKPDKNPSLIPTLATFTLSSNASVSLHLAVQLHYFTLLKVNSPGSVSQITNIKKDAKNHHHKGNITQIVCIIAWNFEKAEPSVVFEDGQTQFSFYDVLHNNVWHKNI